MLTFVVCIQGISALLQHRFSDAEATQVSTRKIHLKKQDPREAAEKAAYRNDAGELYIPGTSIARMLREAGAAHKQRGCRKSLKYVVPAAALVVEEQIVLRDAEGNPLTKFDVDSRPVLIPSTKAASCGTGRCSIPGMPYSPLRCKEDLMDPSLIHQLLFGRRRNTAQHGSRPFVPRCAVCQSAASRSSHVKGKYRRSIP